MTSSNQREMSNIVSESSLISLVNKDQMKHINSKIKSDCSYFNHNFNDLEKSIVAKSIYQKYRQLLELREIAVYTIEKMDQEITITKQYYHKYKSKLCE
jgi:hypothetical protein